MTTKITISEVKQEKERKIARLNSDRQYVGNAATDQRINYILNLSDEEFMRIRNEVAETENRKAAAKAAKKRNTSITTDQLTTVNTNIIGRVKHRVFGEGIVISTIEDKIIVNFDEHGEKILLKNFAKLEMI